MLKKSMMLTMVVVLAMVASVQADNFFQAPDGVEYADWEGASPYLPPTQ